ncbi:hypothetical protein BSK59_12920 [Paenibacillus odorifer]|uniref:hypothetical protein n=1 Tax=Paenibacillus odorifer TaxID=189426 RepID=UPI00096F01A3|nr:hypothetical protein [Paenibacillus odorifer]OME55376.1 hypothetical protein BSK59_12920 [Paenibacillus odorifer]
MEFGQRASIELEIFDQEGNYVTKMDYLKGYELFRNKLIIHTEILSSEFMEFIYSKKAALENDFENSLQQEKVDTYLVDGVSKKCKLVARTYVRDKDFCLDREMMYEIPKATINTDILLSGNYQSCSSYTIEFDLSSFNDQGHIFKIHFKKGV